MILKACDFASKGIDISLKHRFLIDGIISMREKNYRKAIIDATTGLELCLQEYIDNNYESEFIEWKKKKNKQYATLGEKFDILKRVGANFLTENYKKRIVDLRNNVLHNGKKATKSEGENAIKDIKKYFDILYKIE